MGASSDSTTAAPHDDAAQHGGDAVRVLVVDDDPDVRRLVRFQSRYTPGLTVVAEAEDGTRAVELLEQHCPDVVLLDLHMPTPGWVVLPALIGIAPGVRVVVWSADADALATAELPGAAAFCDKTRPWREVARTILDCVTDEPARTATGGAGAEECPAGAEPRLVDLHSLRVVAMEPFDVATTSTATWPCPSCRDLRPLSAAKKVRVADLAPGVWRAELLVCSACADDLAPPVGQGT